MHAIALLLRALRCYTLNRLGLRRPVYATINVTYRCNLRCKFCSLWIRRSEELSAKEMLKVVDEVCSTDVVVVNFSGG